MLESCDQNVIIFKLLIMDWHTAFQNIPVYPAIDTISFQLFFKEIHLKVFN